MMTSSESLSQIALSVGFSDQSHLCKRFKEALGQSPSNWRRERELFGSPLDAGRNAYGYAEETAPNRSEPVSLLSAARH